MMTTGTPIYGNTHMWGMKSIFHGDLMGVMKIYNDHQWPWLNLHELWQFTNLNSYAFFQWRSGIVRIHSARRFWMNFRYFRRCEVFTMFMISTYHPSWNISTWLFLNILASVAGSEAKHIDTKKWIKIRMAQGIGQHVWPITKHVFFFWSKNSCYFICRRSKLGQ